MATCLQPEGTSARTLEHDPTSGRLRMEISHGPHPEDTRRFTLASVEDNERGTASSLENLARLIEER
jgi:hypothetical protein